MIMGGVMSPVGHCTDCGLQVELTEGGLAPGSACPDAACPSYHPDEWSQWDSKIAPHPLGPIDWPALRLSVQPFKDFVRSRTSA